MSKNLQYKKYLDEIENYKPGKAKIDGNFAEIIKLSSNENALKSSKKALEAFKKHEDEIFRYYDGSCVELRKTLAQKNNIDDYEKIVCGAGSDEILALLACAFAGVGDEVIYSKYGFLMYEISAKRVGAKAIAVAEKNLKTDIDAILAAISSKTKMIFIANPNNPTGSYLNQIELQKLIDKVPKSVLIVLDCAYLEFATNIKDYPDAVKLVCENENVVMTRTFSKIYGLASLRIGWCFSSLKIAEILNKVRGPFNVSGAAAVSAIAALQDEEFTSKSQIHNQKWLDKFFENAKNYSKIKLHPSIANFILYDFSSEENCKKANEIFLKNGVIIREMVAYKLPHCLRISIGNDQENQKVLEILSEIERIL